MITKQTWDAFVDQVIFYAGEDAGLITEDQIISEMLNHTKISEQMASDVVERIKNKKVK